MNAPRIVVSLGTDMHSFDRLLEWGEALAVRWPEHRVMIQHGSSRAPKAPADGVQATDRATLLEWYRQADVVITQGGPGSILDVREAGKVPLVVPRDPSLGEHVDGHQMAFVPVMARAGHAVLVTEREHLEQLVAQRLEQPELSVANVRIADPEPAAQELATLVDAALARRTPRGTFLRRARSLFGSRPATPALSQPGSSS